MPQAPGNRPGAIVTDIEGTTTPIAFVHDVLFPYARARLPAILDDPRPDYAEAIAEARALAGGRPVLDALLGWMDADAKVTPLKTLQGLIWDEGFRKGDLHGRLYPDVAPALRGWHASGIGLYVYSSGSEAAQRLLFGHSDAGDLGGLFTGFFDTRIGAKREAGSYRLIARDIGLPASSILFLSDVEQELDAAADTGLSVCQLVRPDDGTVASTRHSTVADFSALASFLR
jgi:enolase-phosphatase E1